MDAILFTGFARSCVVGIATPVHASYFATFDQPILAQGWLYGRPVSAEKFQKLLAAEKRLELAPANAA